MMGKARADNCTELTIEVDISQIDTLVLCPHRPMGGQGILQTSADHPTGIRSTMIAAALLNADARKSETLLVLQIANGKTASNVRKPSSHDITKPRRGREQIMCLERTADVKCARRQQRISYPSRLIAAPKDNRRSPR